MYGGARYLNHGLLYIYIHGARALGTVCLYIYPAGNRKRSVEPAVDYKPAVALKYEALIAEIHA